MLGYSELTPGQKRYVDIVSILFPDIKTEIRYSEVLEIRDYLQTLRKANPSYKIGFPNWLLVNNRVDKGVYFFPKKGVDKPSLSVNITKTRHDDMYIDLLNRFNFERKDYGSSKEKESDCSSTRGSSQG